MPRVTVDVNRCEGHALCTGLAPGVFDLGADDVVALREEPPAEEEWPDVRAAVMACPRQAVTLAED